MAMNREQKRMLQKQGQLGPDGTPMANKQPPAPRQPQQKKERTSTGEFVRGVRSELRKVAWPSRAEVVNLSVLVLVTLGVIMALIFVLDLAFAKSILFLFEA